MRVSSTAKTFVAMATVALVIAAGPFAAPAAASDPGGCGIVIQMCDGIYSPGADLAPGSDPAEPAPRAERPHRVRTASAKKRHRRKHHRQG